MRKIRIGKDIVIRWSILTNGEPADLIGRNLSLELHNISTRDTKDVEFQVEDNAIIYTFKGIEQTSTGKYGFTLWENKGQELQSVIDSCEAFQLVSYSCCEEGEIQNPIILTTSEIEIFTRGLLDGDSGSGIPDAPFDGKTYGRNNGAWVEVEGGASGDFVTDEELAQTLQGYATKEELPDVSGLLSKTEATQTYQLKGDYALKSEIPTSTSQLSNDSGYITEIPSEYITETELSQKGYATTSQLLGKVDKEVGKSLMSDTEIERLSNVRNYDDTEVKTSIQSLNESKADKTEIPSLEGYAKESWVEGQGYLTEHQDLSGKQDKLVSGENIATINGQSLLDGGNIVIEGGSGGTTDYNALSNKPQVGGIELSGNKTLEELGIQPQGDYATSEQLASKADATAIPTKVSQLANDSNYLTAVPDEYVTDTELTQALEGYATTDDIPDTSQLATKTELNAKLDTETYNTDKANFATKDEIGDINTILDNINGEVI